MNIVEEKNEEKNYFLEGDIVKDLRRPNYYIVVREEKGYILRNLKDLSCGWSGHWPSLGSLRDSITTPIQIFSKDEYELVLRKKKER